MFLFLRDALHGLIHLAVRGTEQDVPYLGPDEEEEKAETHDETHDGLSDG